MDISQADKLVPEWGQMIWRFLRGDMLVDEFEPWVYAASQLEALMSPALYLQALDTDYRNGEAVYQLKHSLCAWLDREYPLACNCLRWKDLQKLGISHDTVLELEIDTLPSVFMTQFQKLRVRTPWLSLVRCKQCGQAWYLVLDTEGDDFYLQRLAESDVQNIEQDRWPDTFDQLKAVWPSEGWLRHFGFASLEDWQRQQHS